MNYYTVTQYAKLLGKDPGNIRRYLIEGRIKGEKLGSQWIIPEGTPYPSDTRIKSGNYRNWRDTIQLRQRHPELVKSLSNMCRDLSVIYGDNIDRIVLYGSYSRGEESIDSDVDIAIMLKTPDNDSTHEQMTDIVVDYELSCGVTLSVITIESEHYSAWCEELPFYKNIREDGITLWKTP